MSFSNAARKYVAPTRTDNGMKALPSTGSAVLDYFSSAASARGKDMSAVFARAFDENENLAVRMMLWLRDIREGAGERKQFRDALSWLDAHDPQTAHRIMHKVPELGRWDDLFAYKNAENRQAAFNMIRAALAAGNGLAAKWMPRKGPIAVELTKFFGMSPREYRKTLVALTKVVETQMCAKQWDEINFSHVPSVASARYQKAFGRNASEQYSKYIQELKKPEAERAPGVKINAAAVYPYDVVKAVATGNAAVADEQWKALPNYVGNARILPVIDTSGSMGQIGRDRFGYTASSLQPIEIAISLGLYLSEKNTSDFKDVFITFSEHPEVVSLKGSLSDRIRKMSTASWGYNTNLHGVFKLILDIAKSGKVAAEDMPQSILIVSDMQFDSCVQHDDSAIEMIARKYEQAGYAMPKVVFWNVAMQPRGNTPVEFNRKGAAVVSGFSPSIMKTVLANDLDDYTPYNVMVKTLMKDRYAY